MKIMHLADLHLGKKLNGFSLYEEQKNVLEQAVNIIKKKSIEILLIAGDVFDKSIPSIDAMNLFSWFLSVLSTINVKIYIIPGNHDNAERINYLSSFLSKSNIFICKNCPGVEKYTPEKGINIFLLPYIHPCWVRKFYENDKIENTNDAIRFLINNCEIDEKQINILLAHQFVLPQNEQSDFLNKYAGGLECAQSSLFSKFDYTALGHLHIPKSFNNDKIRYCGSILKYSLNEINQDKSFTILDIKEKNDIKIESIAIHAIRDIKEYRGYIEEFLDKNFYSKIKTDDFIKFTLLDEMVFDAKKKLSSIYPNIILLEFENELINREGFKINAELNNSKTIYDYFCDFYFEQTKKELDKNKQKILRSILDEGGFQCVR